MARPFPTTNEEVSYRFPRLVAHMICESLGYFTPLAAANAILAYREGWPFWCEWYVDGAATMARAEGRRVTDADVLAIGRDVVLDSRRVHVLYANPVRDASITRIPSGEFRALLPSADAVLSHPRVRPLREALSQDLLLRLLHDAKTRCPSPQSRQ